MDRRYLMMSTRFTAGLYTNSGYELFRCWNDDRNKLFAMAVGLMEREFSQQGYLVILNGQGEEVLKIRALSVE